MTDLTPFNDDYDSNNSGNAEFVDIFNKNITRRDLITKTAGGAAAITLAASLTGCGDDNDSPNTPHLRHLIIIKHLLHLNLKL